MFDHFNKTVLKPSSVLQNVVLQNVIGAWSLDELKANYFAAIEGYIYNRLQPVLFDTYISTLSCFIFFLLQIIWWFILSTFGGFLLMYFIYSIREKRGYTIDPLYRGLLYLAHQTLCLYLYLCAMARLLVKFILNSSKEDSRT